MKRVDLVILAGGRGNRISKLTKKIPKPLIKINNIPFIQYLLNYYSKYNLNKIYILTGYRGDKFLKFHKKLSNLVPIECVREKKN
jgi:NDP-sugar pyrophosphorylase family protein